MSVVDQTITKTDAFDTAHRRVPFRFKIVAGLLHIDTDIREQGLGTKNIFKASQVPQSGQDRFQAAQMIRIQIMLLEIIFLELE